MPDIKFREDFAHGEVVVFLDGGIIGRYAEYVTAAKTTQQEFGLSEDDLMTIYRDYKNDYDS